MKSFLHAAKDVAINAKDAAKEAAGTVKDAAKEAAGNVKDVASERIKKIKERGEKDGGEDKRVFGVPVDPTVGIPPIMNLCVHHLDSIGLDQEGLFRKSGSLAQMNEYKARFDKGETVEFDSTIDPHIVAGLLKMYVREYPEPLLTFELYDCFLAAVATSRDVDLKLPKIKQVISMLPRSNLLIVRYLVAFLRRVANKSDVNMMTPSNLAIVFAPNLLRPPYEGAEGLGIMMEDTPFANELMQLFVAHYEVLFTEPVKPPVKPVPATPPTSLSSSAPLPSTSNNTNTAAASLTFSTPGHSRTLSASADVGVPSKKQRPVGLSPLTSSSSAPSSPSVNKTLPPPPATTTGSSTSSSSLALPLPSLPAASHPRPVSNPVSVNRKIIRGPSAPSHLGAETATTTTTTPSVSSPIGSPSKTTSIGARPLPTQPPQPPQPKPIPVSKSQSADSTSTSTSTTAEDGISPSPSPSTPPPKPPLAKPSGKLNGSASAKRPMPTPPAQG